MLTWFRKWQAARRERLLVRLAEGGESPPSEAERAERPLDAEIQGGWGAGAGARRAVYGYEEESNPDEERP